MPSSRIHLTAGAVLGGVVALALGICFAPQPSHRDAAERGARTYAIGCTVLSGIVIGWLVAAGHTGQRGRSAVKRSRYERFIQAARVWTVIAFGVGGIGMAACANLRYESGERWFGIAALVSLVMVVVLVAEQFVTAWIVRRRGRISLAAILLVMAASAVLAAVLRSSVVLAGALLVVMLTLASIAFEERRGVDDDEPS